MLYFLINMMLEIQSKIIYYLMNSKEVKSDYQTAIVDTFY